MPATSIEQIEKELDDPRTNVAKLIEQYRSESLRDLWLENSRLCRAFARRLIADDRAQEALDLLLYDGLRFHPHDLGLRYDQALAHARARNGRLAQDSVKQLLRDVEVNLKVEAEVFCLAGRLRKDKLEQTADETARRQLAREAAEFYERASRLDDTAYASINAASMWLLTGDERQARERSVAAIERAERELQLAGDGAFWLSATLGEANLILGKHEAAAELYREAVQRAGSKLGDIAAMRRNVQLLVKHIPNAAGILPIFNAGPVVIFSGHMVDHPQRLTNPKHRTRFPDDPRLVELVRSAIIRELDALKPIVGYCQGACGSDLLFAEQMLERGAELHLVLPFRQEDFYTTSVDFGYDSLRHWRERFDAVLAQATQVHFATDELYLGDDALFEFVNTFAPGLAIAHARRLGVEPTALVVMESDILQPIGGTADFLTNWLKSQPSYRKVDFAEVRAQLPTPAVLSDPGTPPSSPQRNVLRADVRRQVKTMLFADVKGFSQLREEDAPAFFIQLLEPVAKLIGQQVEPPAFANTWGDGLFMVFDSVVGGAEFALALLEQVRQIEWNSLGREITPRLRVGLHAGPVYQRRDPVIGQKNFFGRHVNRAARIEPITDPDSVFVTEQVAALLAMESNHSFACEYIGQRDLPKDAGRIALYQLGRATL